MSQKSSPLTQRKKFARVAKQLKEGTPLTEAQTRWLIGAFSALSDPNRQADRVLGLKYNPGQSAAKELAASKMDFVMHWIAGAISSDTSHLIDPKDALPPLGIEEAIDQATVIAKNIFQGDPNSGRYDRQYIKKCWYDKDKLHRQKPYRDIDSPDTIYKFPIN